MESEISEDVEREREQRMAQKQGNIAKKQQKKIFIN